MQCHICGNEIVAGERRVPTAAGTVHASCEGAGETAEPKREPSEPSARAFDLKRAALTVAVALVVLLAVRSLLRRRRG